MLYYTQEGRAYAREKIQELIPKVAAGELKQSDSIRLVMYLEIMDWELQREMKKEAATA